MNMRKEGELIVRRREEGEVMGDETIGVRVIMGDEE